jgi:hypothetical protein
MLLNTQTPTDKPSASINKDAGEESPNKLEKDSDADRSIAILTQALAVCRGILYSARTGDASKDEIERLLESTGQESLIALLGQRAFSRAMQLAEELPEEDKDKLLSIGE